MTIPGMQGFSWDNLTLSQKIELGEALEASGAVPKGATEQMKQKEYDKQLDKQSITSASKRLGVSEEKVVAMRKYAKDLQTKQPQMKQLRVQRKVAEYFKVKLT